MAQLGEDLLSFSPLLQSIYITTAIFWGYAASYMSPFNIMDIVVFHIVAILGYFLYLIACSELCAAYLLTAQQTKEYINTVSQLKNDTTFNTLILVPTQREILKFLKFQRRLHNYNAILSAREILKDARKELNQKIITSRAIKYLKNLTFFASYNEVILQRIANIAEFHVVPFTSILTTADTTTYYIYVITRGKCKAISTMKGDKHRGIEMLLKEGDVFPIVEELHNISTFLTVIAITAVEVLCIPRDKLIVVIKSDPLLYKELDDTLKSHLIKDDIILNRKEGRLPPMEALEQSLGQGDMFKYNVNDDISKNLDIIRFHKTFTVELGHWSLLRYLLIRRTCSPSKKFYLVWETIRVIATISQMSLSILFFIFINQLRKDKRIWIARALDVICYLDWYIRLHVQYYNNFGILVTHPLYTAKHYVRTSFIIDIISSLPYIELNVHTIAGRRYKGILASCLILVSRSLQFYRLISWMDYISSMFAYSKSFIFMGIKYAFLFSFISGTLGNITQHLCCTHKLDDVKNRLFVTCEETCWINYTAYPYYGDSHNVILKALFLVLFALTRCGTGDFNSYQVKEGYWFIFLFMMGILIRWNLLIKAVSSVSVTNIPLLGYQHQVNAFLRFVCDENVDEDLIQKTVDYYEFKWKKTLGFSLKETFNKLYPHLRLDCTMQIMYPSLLKVPLFEKAEFEFFRKLCPILTKHIIMKDVTIINCNDIQSQIYIVTSGNIEITVANSRLCVLCIGSIFGNITTQMQIRQTITATTMVHSEVLFCDTRRFMGIAKACKSVNHQLNQIMHFQSEYIKSNITFEDTYQKTEVHRKKSFHVQFLGFFNATTRESNQLVSIYHYIACMIMSPTSSVAFLFLAFAQYYPIQVWQRIIIYTYDFLFLPRICIGATQRYVDPDSGILIYDINKIRKRYFLSFTRFGMDFITILPLEFFARIFTSDLNITKYFTVNRVLRFYFLWRYCRDSERSLRGHRHIHWLYLFYVFVLVHCTACCMWWNIACKGIGCAYVENIGEPNKEFVREAPDYNSLLVCWVYITNLFTTSGMRDVTPLTSEETLSTILIVIMSQGLQIYLMSRCTGELITFKHLMNRFEYTIEKLYSYLKGRELSPVILNKVWNYCLDSWTRSGGDWLPMLIQKAPSSLKQELMYSLYGRHIDQNFLFSKTHVHFIKQLVCHLHRYVYLPGDYITVEGDIDSSMYFIHRGQVEMYLKVESNEKLMDILVVNDSFGEGQGLFSFPHAYSYKARTVCDIIILIRNEWQYLLKYFPASREEIYNRAIEKRITTEAPAYYDIEKEKKQLSTQRSYVPRYEISDADHRNEDID